MPGMDAAFLHLETPEMPMHDVADLDDYMLREVEVLVLPGLGGSDLSTLPDWQAYRG